MTVETIVDAQEQLVLIGPAARFVLVNVARIAERKEAASGNALDESSWQRRVDVASAKQMKRARINVGRRERPVKRKLPFEADG